MKVLTTKPLYAETLVRGMRYKLGYSTQGRLKGREWLAIHASKSHNSDNLTPPGFAENGPMILNDILWPDVIDWDSRAGCIIGVAKVKSVDIGYSKRHGLEHSSSERDLIEVEDVRMLPEPIPYRGNSFIHTLPEEVTAEVVKSFFS